MQAAGAQKASSQPPPWLTPEPANAPEWMQQQAARLDATSLVYSGLTAATVDEVLPALYTKDPKQAVRIAQQIVEQGDQRGQGQSSQPGQSSANAWLGTDWVMAAANAGEEVKTHHEANLMQNRFGEDSPTLFNPARHTVVIAGRPVQATWDGHLVMSHQPCAGNQSFIKLVAFLSLFPGALVASRVYFCAIT